MSRSHSHTQDLKFRPWRSDFENATHNIMNIELNGNFRVEMVHAPCMLNRIGGSTQDSRHALVLTPDVTCDMHINSSSSAPNSSDPSENELYISHF